MSNESLANLLKEERRFAPPAELAAAANVTEAAYAQASEDRLAFWAEQARRLTWATEPTETLDWSNPPFAKWFADGTLNVAYNCVDRHVDAGNGDRVAIHFEGEPGDGRSITYAQLKDEVSQAANALLELGVTKGDRVAVYLPMIAEAVVAMLACARIGATHSVVFGGFSADAVASRIQDADAKLVITGGLPPRQGHRPQARHRRGPRQVPPGRARPGGPPHRPGHRLHRGPGRLVARDHRPSVHRAHARGARRRAPAVHPLHLRHHR